MRKYSDNYERDYKFYLENIHNFDFCGTLSPKYQAIPDENGRSAKEVFYLIDSTGKNSSCNEPELLNALLLCKAGVNFQIRQWSECRVDGTLPLIELSKKLLLERYLTDENILHLLEEMKSHKVIEWVNNEPIYFYDIQTKYGLPDWVIDAIEKQSLKIYKQITIK